MSSFGCKTSATPVVWTARRSSLRAIGSGWALLLAGLCVVGCKKSEPETASQTPVENKSGEVSSGSLDTSAVLNFLSSLGLSTGSKDKEKDASSAKVEQFNSELAHWKQRALAEFPELGRAGSSFNKRFLDSYNQLKAADAPELKLPNWPYLVAVKVSAFSEAEKVAVLRNTVTLTSPVSQASSAPTDALRVSAGAKSDVGGVSPVPVIPPGTPTPDRFATYQPKDALDMNPLPIGGIFKGTITKLNKQIAGGDLDVVLILDGILQCEVNLNTEIQGAGVSEGRVYYPWYYYGSSTVRHSSTLELVEAQNSIKLVQKNRATAQYSGTSYSNAYYSRPTRSATSSQDLLTLRVGQTVLVEGVFVSKAGKKPFVRGVVKSAK